MNNRACGAHAVEVEHRYQQQRREVFSKQAFDRSIMPGDGDEPFTASGTPDDAQGGGPDVKPVRRFTWRELSKLNEPHNAHVAVRGKVGDTVKKKLIPMILSESKNSDRCMM